jgi:hypothetical protein
LEYRLQPTSECLSILTYTAAMPNDVSIATDRLKPVLQL